MSKAVDIFDGILFVRTRHYDKVKKVVVLQGNKPEKRFFDNRPKSETFEWCNGCKEYDYEQHCCHRFTKVIRDTVEEMKEYERPKGKWISHYDYCAKHGVLPSSLIAFWWCEQCEQAVEQPTNFCPKCGADMRGDV